MKARFIQTNPDGSQQAGTFYLKRPGRLRFEYDPPDKDFIVADGTFIYFYDSQLKQQSNMPISHSLANFFLRKNLRLGGDVTVTRVAPAGNMITVTLVQTQDPAAGSLTIGLMQHPLALKKWRVVDAQGAITEVELFHVKTGIPLKSDMFYYVDPEHNKPKYN